MAYPLSIQINETGYCRLWSLTRGLYDEPFMPPLRSFEYYIAQAIVFIRHDNFEFTRVQLLQSICTQEIIYHLFQNVRHQDKGRYNPKFRQGYNNNNLTRITGLIPESITRLLPLPPPQLGQFMGIPTIHPEQSLLNNNWNDCMICGGQTTFSSTQNALLSHRPKKCPFIHASYTYRKSNLEYNGDRHEGNGSPLLIFDSMTQQIDELNNIFQVVRPVIMKKYASFLYHTHSVLPANFSGLLITENGDTYNNTRLYDGINQLVIDAQKIY